LVHKFSENWNNNMKKQQSIMVLGAAFTLLSAPIFAGQATLIENGSFDNGSSIPWETPGFWVGDDDSLSAGSFEVDDRGRFCTTVTQGGSRDWQIQLRQSEKEFIEGETYKISYSAWASEVSQVAFGANDESVQPNVGVFFAPNETITASLEDEVGTEISYEITALASTEKAKIRFAMGGGLVPDGATLCIDDVVVEPPAKNLINNPTFENEGEGWEVPAWWAGGAGTTAVDVEGRMCTTVTTEGTADWGAQLRQVGNTLVAGRTYTVAFDAWSSTDMIISYDVLDEGAGYVNLLNDPAVNITARLEDAAQRFEASYEVTVDSSDADFRFLFGGGNVPAGETVCIDNVELMDPEGYSVIQPEEPEVAAVHVNQVGYAPQLAKIATYKLVAEDATAPRVWELLNSNSDVVVSGSTQVIGDGITADQNSGDIIHQIDFTNYTVEGTDYVLQVKEGDDVVQSHPFDIGSTLLSDLKYDALTYFYHNRSGIEILESVVGDAKWARPVGHEGDVNVETFVCVDEPTSEDCYAIDSSGGWYDAGDHGKYVVNGGISVWTLMNQFERSKYLGRNSADFGVASDMPLPADETANSLPDILDEAKWEMEWMLKMQVPAGKNFAGMAFHKMHSLKWTGDGVAPHEDDVVRYVQAPTTAATLNLAATAAQCARVYKGYDDDLANRCLAAAKTALAAAKANPAMYAGIPAEDDPNPERFSMTNEVGGGLYGDIVVGDEFFWAFAELYATTKEDTYEEQLLASDYYGVYALPSEEQTEEVPASLYYWGNTNMLGAMSIATVGEPKELSGAIVQKQYDLLTTAADAYVSKANEPGYSLPMNSDEMDWGSNSGIVNNMMVLGLANDISCAQDTTYVDAMAKGMSYLLGNNPLGISYVTGYGENAVQNPHHRFWAKQVKETSPPPPPGALSGGPNSTFDTTGDGVALAKIDANCAPETCYVDNYKAWSVNEITINWNSPLSWVVAYLDENMQQGLAASQDACAVVVEPEPEPEPEKKKKKKGGAGIPIFLGMALLFLRRRS
jgi:endoglucanase